MITCYLSVVRYTKEGSLVADNVVQAMTGYSYSIVTSSAITFPCPCLFIQNSDRSAGSMILCILASSRSRWADDCMYQC